MTQYTENDCIIAENVLLSTALSDFLLTGEDGYSDYSEIFNGREPLTVFSTLFFVSKPMFDVDSDITFVYNCSNELPVDMACNILGIRIENIDERNDYILSKIDSIVPAVYTKQTMTDSQIAFHWTAIRELVYFINTVDGRYSDVIAKYEQRYGGRI